MLGFHFILFLPAKGAVQWQRPFIGSQLPLLTHGFGWTQKSSQNSPIEG